MSATARGQPKDFHRYHIGTAEAPPLAGAPGRFSVKISTVAFLRMAASLVADSRSLGDLAANFGSRPCIYGVYDGTFGGLEARESLCRGCLRCMVEHPDVARIEADPRYKRLGDGYWRPEQVLTIWNEAATGKIPVRGMGYGGPFKGPGFDNIWTDMSEIVRPTRDGIHGREYISTAVDLGSEPMPLGPEVAPLEPSEPIVTLPLPIVFRALPRRVIGSPALEAMAEAAGTAGTLIFLGVGDCDEWLGRRAPELVPLVNGQNWSSRAWPSGIRVMEWDVTREALLPPLEATYLLPKVLWSFRVRMEPGFEDRVVELARRGATCIRLEADLHGSEWGAARPRHLTELLRSVHRRLVAGALRDRVTLIAGGGIAAAEHVPKAILCGADLVSIDAAALVALQTEWQGEWRDPGQDGPAVPRLPAGWAAQRLLNLLCAWRDQLLEILGAMGLRDVRRLRGEVGRAMFADELEREVFEPLFGRKRGSGG
ncbi:MAG: hypothetical protein HY303_04920 [Candidatus Wallbacteria bacterium]|nr:hypothetical protein [Candidatus Wallbacteria bacterium]